MSLADIDATVTRRRIQDAVDASRKTLENLAQGSAEIDAQFREAAAKEEAELTAALERKAAAEAEAARLAAEQEKDKQAEEPKPRPRPSTLSLGADEFKEARQVKQVVEETKPAAPPPPAEPETRDEPARPGRTLKLGARDDAADEAPPPGKTFKLGARDDEEPQPEARPVRRPRPPRAEGDDDLSGRTWLR
ncbi:MAG: hypothetical protein WBA97_15560 [Actinophytocola sp.]|uniref:hypothetical protein n=1 Tax=Actinophytocola sp. TaxID=1872138 RepID=UPI003C76C6BA